MESSLTFVMYVSNVVVADAVYLFFPKYILFAINSMYIYVALQYLTLQNIY